MAEPRTNEEIDEDIRKMHDDAKKKIEELQAEKEEPSPTKEELTETPVALLRVVPPKEIPTFEQWFKGKGMAAELNTLSGRRGMTVPLMTAYTNLDILRCLGAIAGVLKEIPDLIQDQIDSTNALGKKIDALAAGMKEVGAATKKVEGADKEGEPKTTGRKRTPAGG